jgi:hypothetical protein
LRDALGEGLVELQRDAEGQRAQDGQLVRGVDALDVEGRVGLGIAERAAPRPAHRRSPALVAHLGEDEVAGAVDDAGDPLDMVGGQALAQGLDDGMPPATAASKATVTPFGLGGGEDLVAVQRDQRLVGGDHVLAVLDGLQHQLAGRRIAADQLDDDIDLGIIDDGEGVVADAPDLLQALMRSGSYSRAAAWAICGCRARRGGRSRRRCGQHGDGAAADGAEPSSPILTGSILIAAVLQDVGRIVAACWLESTSADRVRMSGAAAPLGDGGPGFPQSAAARASSRNICLMPRTAWRVRCSFSIRPKRT